MSQQTKIQMSKQSQIELQQNHTVMQDLSNVLGILVEYLAVKETYDERLTAVYLNRLTLQINLSNTIHFSLVDQAKQTNTKENLVSRKQEALSIFHQIIEILKKYNILKDDDQYLQLLFQTYSGVNLSENEVRFQQFQLQPIKEQSKLNELSMQKLIDIMNETNNVKQIILNYEINNQSNQYYLLQREVMFRYIKAKFKLQLMNDWNTRIIKNQLIHNQLSLEMKQIMENLAEILCKNNLFQKEDIYEQLIILKENMMIHYFLQINKQMNE